MSTNAPKGIDRNERKGETAWESTERLLLQIPRPICLVGNAAMKYRFRTAIDSYATVIRMNNFRIRGFEESVGTKTDFRCVTGWRDVENRNEHPEFSPFTAEAPESSNLASYNARNQQRVLTAAHDVKFYIPEVSNPSAGFALVQLFDMLDIPVDLFGFDGFRTDHYWRNRTVETTHSAKEIDFILKRRHVVLYNDYGMPADVSGSHRNGSRPTNLLSVIPQSYKTKRILLYDDDPGEPAALLQRAGNEVTILEPCGFTLDELSGIRTIRGGPLALLGEDAEYDVFIAGEVLTSLPANEGNILARQLPRLCREILLALPHDSADSHDHPGVRLKRWKELFSNAFDVMLLPETLPEQHILAGHRTKSPSPAALLPPGLPADFCLKTGYQSRTNAEYFEDSIEETGGIIWQPDVYVIAGGLASLLGCTKIIDLGCGQGHKLVRLHPEFDIVGIDSGINLQYCRQHHDCGRWMEWDLELPASPPVDDDIVSQSVIVCSDVIEHLADPSPLVHTIRSWLQRSPAAVLSTPERDLARGSDDFGPPGNPAHVREWNLDEFTRLLASAGMGVSYCGLTRSNDRDDKEETILCIVQREPDPEVATWVMKCMGDRRKVREMPAGPPKRVGLFGASSRGSQYLKSLAGNSRLLPVCFFDNDPAKWGTHFESLPVLSPEIANLELVDLMLVASIRVTEIVDQLTALGWKRRVAIDVHDLIH